jgi:hypothetical protein
VLTNIPPNTVKTMFCILFSIPFWSCVVADNANLSEKIYEIVSQNCADFIQDVHNLWSLPTHSPTGTARKAIMGKVVIMPLELSKEYSNIIYSLLDRSKGLILLHNRLLQPHSELSLLKK